MKRIFLGLATLLIVLITVPPTWFALFPMALPALPPAGSMVALRENVKANVIDVGAGQPIVLSHGLPGMSYDWRELTPELVDEGFRVIAYDRLGYGHSDLRPTDDYTVNANAIDLLGLIETLDLDEVVVAGWSYGGAIAMQAAQADPSSIHRIVLIGTAGPSSANDVPPDPSVLQKVLYSAPVSLWRQAVPPLSHSLMTAFSDSAFNGAPQPGWFLDGLKSNLGRPATALTFRREIFSIGENNDARPEMITQPTLLIHGEKDRNAPVAISRYLSSTIPNAKFVEVANAGHMLPVTNPALLAREIRSFATPR